MSEILKMFKKIPASITVITLFFLICIVLSSLYLFRNTKNSQQQIANQDLVYYEKIAGQGEAKKLNNEINQDINTFVNTYNYYQNLSENDKKAVDEEVRKRIDQLKTDLNNKAEALLKKNICDFTLDDIDQATQLAAAAMSATDGELGESLWGKANKAFGLNYHDYAASFGSIVFDNMSMKGIDKLRASTPREALSQLNSQLRQIIKQRNLLAKKGYMFGYHDEFLAQIYRNRKLEVGCIQLWDIKVDFQYSGKLQGLKENWGSTVTFSKVPIYVWKKNSNVPPLINSYLKQGTVTQSNLSYHDGGGWISCRPEGTFEWYLEFNQKEKDNDYWGSILMVSLNMNQFEAISVCDDGVRSPLSLGDNLRIDLEKIDPLNIVNRRFFKIQRSEDNENGKGTLTVQFTPTNRVLRDEIDL